MSRPATLRVAALQLNSATGDVGGNLARCRRGMTWPRGFRVWHLSTPFACDTGSQT